MIRTFPFAARVIEAGFLPAARDQQKHDRSVTRIGLLLGAWCCLASAIWAADQKDVADIDSKAVTIDASADEDVEVGAVEDSDAEDSNLLGGAKRERIAVSISGRAADGRGKPISGAKIYVIPSFPLGTSYHNNEDRPLAEGTTDNDGKYHFEQVKLFVYDFKGEAVPRPKEGQFQVVGFADHQGYVWRATTHYRPAARPGDAEDDQKETEKPKKGRAKELIFYEGEPIVIDLRFTAEVRLHGKITDDLGNPLKDVTVQVGFVSFDRGRFGTEPNGGGASYLEASPRGADGALEFNALSVIPEANRLTRTDENGHYEVRGLPKNASVWTRIDYRSECEPFTEQVGTGQKAAPSDDKSYFARELNRTFKVPTTWRVQVVDEAQKPVVNALVRYLTHFNSQRSGTLARTDESGVAVLYMTSKEADLFIEPTFGQRFLPHHQAIRVKPDDPKEKSLEVTLKPAVEVTLEAVDVETGNPVPGVSFLYETGEGGQRNELQSQLSFVDHPRTDRSGQLVAIIEPGKTRFLVDRKSLESGLEAKNPISEIVDVQPDGRVALRFEFSRKSDSHQSTTKDKDLELPERFVELIEKQQLRFKLVSGFRFQVDHIDGISVPISADKVKEILDAVESKSLDQCVQLLKDARARNAYHTGGNGWLLTDGVRKRLDQDGDYTGGMPEVENGRETIRPMNGTQLDIHTAGQSFVHTLGMHDFWQGPMRIDFLKQLQSDKLDSPRVSKEEGFWRIDIVKPQYRIMMLIDEFTGLVRTKATYAGDRMISFEGQYFPVLSNGLAIPQLCVRFEDPQRRGRRAANKPGGDCTYGYTHIKKVELLKQLPPDAFIVSVPPGVHVIDYRGYDESMRQSNKRPPSGVLTASIPDIIAYRNQFAPPQPPVLKIGEKAPDLDVESWIDASGRTTAPALKGKVVLIDFWGIGCGPCVGQLPEVNAACEYFAKNPKLAIIGLHDSGPPADVVQSFAKKRDLIFSTAIDKPQEHSFGRTFSKFGIEGMPASVVIDVEGTVVYIGEFKHAIKVAADLVK